jgi:hypothetical protein
MVYFYKLLEFTGFQIYAGIAERYNSDTFWREMIIVRGIVRRMVKTATWRPGADTETAGTSNWLRHDHAA